MNVEDFWSHVDRRGREECWPWKGPPKNTGYGQLRFKGKVRSAHQVAFFLTHGYWPPYLRHSCDFGLCCNDAHLIVGTHAENMRDAVERGRQPKGEAHWKARLTGADVIAIRADPRGCRRLAKAYGVTSKNIQNIRKRKTWRHVP